jgi:CubicO group peptidase (beta-lactamase class C family)
MFFRSACAALALTAAAGLPALAQTPSAEPVSDARALGFDPAAFEALDARLEALAAAGARPGYAAIIARGEQIAHVSEAGVINVGTGAPFTIDSPVRIASMTKPVTAVATLMLVEDGEIALDDPVSDYIPAFADIEVAVSPQANEAGEIETRAPETVMTVHHLLTHTSGLGYIFDNRTDLGRLYIDNSLYSGEGNLEARMEQLAALPLYNDPGDTWQYSYANDVLGRIVEVASGMPFEDYLESEIFEPLDMPSTGFFFEDVDFTEAEMSPLYIHGEDGSLSEYPESFMPDWASGGGGLVSTASDYIRFAMMLANDGALGDVRILEPETVAMMASSQLAPEQLSDAWAGRSYGYGVDVVLPPEDGAQPAGVPGDFSWGGFFDTDFFVSPSTDVSAVILTQIQPGPNRPDPRTSAVFRPMVYASFAFD